MNHMPTFNRRSFVIGTAAVGAGLALGLDIPFGGPTVVRAADGSPEVNAWVVIRPDDTVVIRIARRASPASAPGAISPPAAAAACARRMSMCARAARPRA